MRLDFCFTLSLYLSIIYVRDFIDYPDYFCVLLFILYPFAVTPWLFLGCRVSCVWGNSNAYIRKCPDCIDIVSWLDLATSDDSG